MPTPRNTSDDTRNNPLGALLPAVILGPSNFIEHQEAEGQREMVESTVLPTDRNRWGDGDERYTDLGFTFGEIVAGDPMFQEATLPEGWKREGSSHAMWSYIVDERGLRRCSIFYKAAFYDRSAHMSLINVGREVWGDVSNAGKYPDSKPEGYEAPWDILTDDEKADYLAGVVRSLADIERYPDIWDKDGTAKPKAEAERDRCLADGVEPPEPQGD